MPDCILHPILSDHSFLSFFSERTIRVVAPASGLSHDIALSIKTLPSLHVEMSDHLLSSDVPYHANTDEQRLIQLKSALYDPNPNMLIWCLRGGYGCARLIEKLDELEPPQQEKIFIGYSDITALHLFLSQKWGWRTFHAAGFAQLLNSKWHIQNFKRLEEWLRFPSRPQLFPDLTALNIQAKEAKLIQGKMNGGNLTLIENSIGTSWQIRTAGCILFLEEIGEKGYRIDRMLTHLKQAHLFESVKAVIFGECLDGDAAVEFALQRFANEVSFPVFQSKTFGHGSVNYPIPYQSEGCIEGLVLRIQLG